LRPVSAISADANSSVVSALLVWLLRLHPEAARPAIPTEKPRPMTQFTPDDPLEESSRDTSISLLDGIRDDESGAWRRLRCIYEPLVLYWCKRYAGLSVHDAADIAQETFTAVYKSFSRIQWNESGHSFRGWLRTITVNKIRDWIRKEKRNPSARDGTTVRRRLAEVADPALTQDSDDEASETKLILRKALEVIRAEFAETSWRAFWRTTVDELPAADVADELEMTVGAVYTAKSRVLARLRQLLKGLEDKGF
jgi:RNA polymerase sigma-70 factor (ECF subfamily)